MKRGTVTINLTFEIEFPDDGFTHCVTAIRSDEHLVEMKHENALIDALPEALWEQIKVDAWDDAVPVDDGHEADEAEFCGRAG